MKKRDSLHALQEGKARRMLHAWSITHPDYGLLSLLALYVLCRREFEREEVRKLRIQEYSFVVLVEEFEP